MSFNRASLLMAYVLLAPAATMAQQGKPPTWNEFVAIPVTDLPISIQLKGWEEGKWATRARKRDGIDADKQGKVFYYEGLLNKDGYYGYVSALETSHDRIWIDEPLKDTVAKRDYFKGGQLAFEPQSSLDIWPAKFRYILFTAQKNGKTANCLDYLTVWRSYMVEGFVCNDSKPINDGAARTFLKSLGYKNELSPVEGALE
jgi:hypothetical protein